MQGFNIPFFLLHISTLLIASLFIFIYKMKQKSQLHLIFLCNMALVFIWSLGHIIEVYTSNIYGYTLMVFVYLWYFGLIFLPLSLLFTGIIFAQTKIKLTKQYFLLFVFPIIDYLFLVSNEIHKLYIVKYSLYNNVIKYGSFFIVHTVFSYTYIIIGLYFLLFFSIKNSGFFSKQSFLIITGISIPFIVNIFFTFNLIRLPAYSTPVTFTFAIICFSFAIFKFDFLNITPIALQKIVDLISDSYIIINENFDLIDYNQTFINIFSSIAKIKRKDNLFNFLSSNSIFGITSSHIKDIIEKAIKDRKTFTFEKHMVEGNFDRYFKIEITPIYSSDICLGTIILLKDITQAKQDLEIIKENQAILLEQERLASLGQLIGGIAHNLKTPIMSISGGIEALKDLTYEYRDSIDDRSVTEQDHKEIARDMLSWLDRMKPYCSYMSDVISAVKGQAVQMNATSSVKFTVDELVKRVDLLMRHELKRFHCILNLESNIDMSTEIKGEVNNLVQVFDNIIINAMQAYEGKNGTIDLKIVRSGDNVEFTFRDYGKGIPKNITDRLFKEMITTKGKNGTGLGLYMSYSTIKGRFGGNMSFTSKEGCGTTFFICIPCITYSNQEAG